MSFVDRLSIRIKLLLLAGVPVVGALVLAAMMLRDARQRANAAAALGSIEDLARLSEQMSRATQALQAERAFVALGEGSGERPGATAAPTPEPWYRETRSAGWRRFLPAKICRSCPRGSPAISAPPAGGSRSAAPSASASPARRCPSTR
jgi:hypothetical protein